MSKLLSQIHEDVPPLHYDLGYKKNPLQRYWHSQRLKHLKKSLPSKLGLVLDIGCHSAFLTEKLLAQSHYKKLKGIDISKKAIDQARKRMPKAYFKVGNIHSLPYQKQQFDYILCIEVLEHVEIPSKVIAEIKRVLKKNGELLILVPTDNLLFRIIWTIWNKVYPVWNHAHIQSFKGDSLARLLSQHNLKILEQKKFNLNMLLLVKARKTNP